MLRWIGYALILGAGAGIGYAKGQELQKRLKRLEELRNLFAMLKGELEYKKTPFWEAFANLAEKTDSPYSGWFQDMSRRLKEKEAGSFWTIWCLAIQEHLQDGILNSEELEELRQVGKNPEYIENLDLFLEQMEYRITWERENYRSKRKLSQSMGIMGGIFLVILLI